MGTSIINIPALRVTTDSALRLTASSGTRALNRDQTPRTLGCYLRTAAKDLINKLEKDQAALAQRLEDAKAQLEDSAATEQMEILRESLAATAQGMAEFQGRITQAQVDTIVRILDAINDVYQEQNEMLTQDDRDKIAGLEKDLQRVKDAVEKAREPLSMTKSDACESIPKFDRPLP